MTKQLRINESNPVATSVPLRLSHRRAKTTPKIATATVALRDIFVSQKTASAGIANASDSAESTSRTPPNRTARHTRSELVSWLNCFICRFPEYFSAHRPLGCFFGLSPRPFQALRTVPHLHRQGTPCRSHPHRSARYRPLPPSGLPRRFVSFAVLPQFVPPSMPLRP